MKNISCSLLVVLSLASAHADGNLPINSGETFSDILAYSQLTPIEQTARGRRLTGVYDFHQSQYCSPRALSKVEVPVDENTMTTLSSSKVLDSNRYLMTSTLRMDKTVFSTDFTVGTYTQLSMINPISDAMKKLVKFGDRDVGNHFVCVGLYDFGYTNAISFGAGYIFGSPEVPLKLNKESEHFRDGWFSTFTFLHEFGHQLQYWTNEPLLNDSNSRRLELQADCAASALMTMSENPIHAFARSDQDDAAAQNAAYWGDSNFEKADHHGTKYERYTVVQAGMRQAYDWQRKHGLPYGDYTGLTGRVILNRCRILINQRDQAQGANWKPGWDWNI